MPRASVPRFEGSLTSWNDERGFGFVQPTQGGPEVFVHIKAFETRARRPVVGEVVTFEVERAADGRKRARKVSPSDARHRAHAAPRARDGKGLASVAAFLVLLAVATVRGMPVWVALAYIAASVVCFFAYALDKINAIDGRRRVPESRLLAIGTLGGWPGAIVAQQLLRHKTIKRPFLIRFWIGVAANVAVFGWMAVTRL